MANEKVTIQELADGLAIRSHCTKAKSELFLRKLFSLIQTGLNSDSFVKIKGLGTFKLVTVGSRQSVDVNTGERIEISEHLRLLFTPDNSLKARVNKPFEKFDTIIIDGEDNIDGIVNEIEEETIIENEPEAIENEEPVLSVEENLISHKTIEKSHPINNIEEKAEDRKSNQTIKQKEIEPQETELQKEISTPDTISSKEDEETDVVPVVTSLYIGRNEDRETEEEVKNNPSELVDSKEAIVSQDEIETTNEDIELGNDTSSNSKFSIRKALLWITIPCLMIISYLVGYYHLFDGQTEVQEPTLKPKQTNIQTPKVQNSQAKKALQDSIHVEALIQAQKKDSIAKVQKEKQLLIEQSKQYEQLNDADFLIVGTLLTHEMKETDTLLRLAKKYYGNKDFVRYIVFYNHLENPDNVKLGTILKMPQLIKKTDLII